MFKVNKQIVIEKINLLRMHRFYQLTSDKLNLILGQSFCDWLISDSDEIDSSILAKLQDSFLISKSYFLNKSNYNLQIVELIKYNESTNKILTCFVPSREVILSIPSSMQPHDIFTIPIFEIRDQQLLHPNEKPNNYLLFKSKDGSELQYESDMQIKLHYDVVNRQCLLSEQLFPHTQK